MIRTLVRSFLCVAIVFSAEISIPIMSEVSEKG